MSVALTNIKLGSGNGTPTFNQCNSITFVDSSGVSHDIASAWYASGTTGATEFWEKATSATLINKNAWACEYVTPPSGDCTGFIFYAPSTTHSFTSIEGKSTRTLLYGSHNSICGMAEITDNGDGTYQMSKWVYVDSGHNSTIATGETIDGNAIYYMKNTYSSSGLVNSWAGSFETGKLYAIAICERYADYGIVTGSKTSLVGAEKGFEDWAIGNDGWLIKLKTSSHTIYGEVLV